MNIECQSIKFPRTYDKRKKKKNANVNPVPRGSKTASQPKTLGPLAGTIVPSVLPSNKTGSDPEKKYQYQ